MAKIQHSHVTVAPSQGQIIAPQFTPCSVCRFIRDLRLSVSTLTSHRGLALHYSKVKKWKVFFFYRFIYFIIFFFYCHIKVSRGSNTMHHVKTSEEECIDIDQVKSSPRVSLCH
ncbi:hypothetical protein ATANTOWER_018490 [Ataeniobius toweri]|uniref:Uncharacterized protein n=1 Tax=Ataeniobius toweri TaxID=208326 RepID=A0ABU7C121_9TELE|nr:hypothetical protein [Ataeniobius toweri]